MVGLSASVNLPLHHKLQKFSSGTGSPGWSQKKGREMVVVLHNCTKKSHFKRDTIGALMSLELIRIVVIDRPLPISGLK